MKKKKRAFRGNFCPVELWNLFDQKKITPRQFILILLIDSYVRGGKGCWVSNKKLARMIGLSSGDWVKKQISQLCKKGYLIRVGIKKIHGRNFRLLEAFWSNPLRGGFPLPPHEGNEETPPSGVVGDPTYNNKYKYDINKKDNSVGDSPTEGMFPPSANGELKSPSQRKSSPFARKMAKKLWRKVYPDLPKRKANTYKLPTWVHHITLLVTKDKNKKSHVREVMEWYIKNYNRRYCPKVLSGESFRAKFGDLEYAMNQQQAQRDNTTDEVPDSSQTLGWSEA